MKFEAISQANARPLHDEKRWSPRATLTLLIGVTVVSWTAIIMAVRTFL